MNRALHPMSRRRQSGLTLVELLVAMLVGLAVVGVGTASYLNVATNTRTANVIAQMNEDATAALTILRNQVALAGFSTPVGATTTSTTINGVPTTVTVMQRAYTPDASNGGANNFLVGCDGGFANPRSNELLISQLACDTTATAPDALAVVYQATLANTYPARDGSNNGPFPTDCLGNTVLMRSLPTTSATPYLASNKFYVATNASTGRPELYCLGNGRNSSTPASPTPWTASGDALPSTVAAQALVENITDLQITYGVAGVTSVAGGSSQVDKTAVAYLTASQIRALSGSDTWNRVVSVRLCIEVQSSTTVSAAAQTQYLNCQGNVATPADATRLVRTYSTTVVLHNRI